MSLTYAVCEIDDRARPIPALPLRSTRANKGEKALGAGVPSAIIEGPCEILMVPEAKMSIDIVEESGTLAPAASPILLLANSERAFLLTKSGRFKLSWAAA